MSTVTIEPDPLVRQRGLTRRHWQSLVEAGLLEGDHVELVEGMIIEMVPQGDQHSFLTTELTHRLVRGVPEPWRVRVQMPLAASDTSEPEPDLAVVRPTGSSPLRVLGVDVDLADLVVPPPLDT